MSNRNQGNHSGRGGRQPQWGRGGVGGRGVRQQQHHHGQHNSRQDQQSWPRQQQLPQKQGSSWNRDGGRQQQRPQQGGQKNDGPRGWQQGNQRQSQKQQQQQQQQNKTTQEQPQQKPREFKAPPPRPNAWGVQAAKQSPQVLQTTPQQTTQQTQTQQAPAQEQATTAEPRDAKAVAAPEPVTSEAENREPVPGTMGAWSTKFNTKKAAASAPAGPSVRGQKVAPVILQKPKSTNADAGGLPNKKAKMANNKKDNANSSNNNNSKNSNNASNNKKIHGKKPKLSSISMGDLIPNIKKIIPKDKNKKANASQSTQGQGQANSHTQTQTPTQVLQAMDTTASSDFPALPAASNWPSLAASKPAASSTAAAPVATAKKAPPPPKQTKSNNSSNNSSNNHSNNNNTNKSKKRKNQAQQAQDTKKGVTPAKTKNGINLTTTTVAKADEAHLAAAFFLPPGKSLDPAHLQAQFGAGVSGTTGVVGAQHDLMKMMQGGQVVKGRQRLKPRKKRFTALKRKILLERLRVWKELHPEEDGGNNKSDGKNGNGNDPSCTICVYGFASLEEVEDPDEYEELLENLKDMADKMGKVRHVFIPQSSTEEDGGESEEHPAFVHFSTPAETMAARGVWDRLVIGGQALIVRSLTIAPSIDNANDDEGEETEIAWQQACLEAERSNSDEAMEDLDSTNTFRILLKNVLTEDDLEDDECFAESIQDIKQMVEKFGLLEDVQSKKQDGSTDVIIVYKGGQGVAQTVLEELQQLTLGGSQLSAEILPTQASESRPAKLLLENILTEDDLDDEDCLEESLNDVRSLLEKFGTVASMDATGAQIIVAFSGMTTEALQGVSKELNSTCLGGQTIRATVILESPTTMDDLCVMLRNLLTEDDLEDDECLEESLGDVRELAQQYGTVKEIEVDKGDDVANSVVKVTYSTESEAELAMKQFNGMVVGGETISASRSLTSTNLASDTAEAVVNDNDDKAPPGEQGGEPKPMFSGDKRIPERFAECKRVPKVPNKGTPRNYAILTNNDTVKPLLVEMLTELMRLQMRALHSQNAKNSKARRRVVIGLREVARGIRANKVKMVVMANNLDEYGAIDDKLQEILDLAAEKEIPVLFELSKRVLGKAVGKKIKVSVCAVQATDGAHQQFVKLSKFAPKLEPPPPCPPAMEATAMEATD